MDKLILIQEELKVPKNQFNNFGKYHYRSCEDIVEAVKPLCAKYDCLLTISDEMVEVGGRVYVKATATLTCGETSVYVYGWAREAMTKKGMDDSQITGATSSYARKYALNGLFAIDDTKDADTKSPEENTLTDIDKLHACSTLDELKTVWNSIQYKSDPEVLAKKEEMKNKLTK